jgi:lactate permease
VTGSDTSSNALREGDLLRKVVGWSIVLMALMRATVYLQSTSLLSWMVP